MARKQIQDRRYCLGGKRKAEQDRFFKEALDAANWQPGDAEHWDACWYTGMPEVSQFLKAGPDRKINHIPGNGALTLKDRLYETLSAMRDRQEEQYGPDHDHVTRLDFVPRVYSMPRDYHALQQAALDDPDTRWILKPKNSSRGRGVRVLREVASVPPEDKWMVQEYRDKPHRMKGRKYVLRLYVVISSITPLRVYLYRQGFAKLASAKYEIDDVDNVFSHLTNPDVNALNADAEVPVEFVDLDLYRQWLRGEGHDDEALFERVRDLVTLTAIAAVEHLRERTRAMRVDARGCYELLGVDCLIDEDLKPWLLECNLSPSVEVCAGPDTGGRVEEQVKRQLLTDMTALVGLLDETPAHEDADPLAQIRQEAESELARAGGFQRVYPGVDVEGYLPFFSLPRLADMVLADGVNREPVRRPTLQSRFATELIVDDQLVLYDERSGELHRLNATATFIWLSAMDGMDPDIIAEQLSEAVAGSAERVPDILELRKDVWDALADWARRGLIMQEGPGPRYPPAPKPPVRTALFQCSLRFGALRLSFHTDSEPVVAQLQSWLASLNVPDANGQACSRLEVVRDTPGYTIVFDGEVIASKVTLAALEPLLSSLVIRHSAGAGEVVLDVTRVTGADTGPLIFAGKRSGLSEAFARHFARHSGGVFDRGLRLSLPAFQRYAIVLPVLEDRPRESLLQSLSLNKALEHLLPACVLSGGTPLDADHITAFAEWLSLQTLYTLDITDHSSACETLTRVVSSPQLSVYPAAEMVSAV
jgi:hypothetical protein